MSLVSTVVYLVTESLYNVYQYHNPDIIDMKYEPD